MTDSNRLRLTTVRESSLGVTPVTPRMRTMRITGEGLKYEPQFVQSAELRSDRMNADPIKINEQNSGPVNFEFSYPVQDGSLADFMQSMMFNPWVNTPTRDNDGTADSVITALTGTTDVVTCTTGPAFAAGQIARFSGFATGANNGVFKCTTGGATAPAFLGAGFVTEAAPPAAARIKVVGFQGASGDVTALADGLGSTALDFTTLGLVPGQWVKIGGIAAGDKFAAAVCNGWARTSGAITATKIPLDNLPVGWTTDDGSGKTIKVWFGDQIKNGVTMTSQTIERGFMGQAVPTYIAQRGMVVGQASFNWTTEQVISGSFTMNGLTGEQGTTPLDASPDAETTNRIMAANVDVGRIAESGASVGSPNWIRALTMNVNNNLRMKTAVGNIGSVDIGVGELAIDVTLETYFGDNALLTKLLAGTVGNLNCRTAKDGQAVVMALPRLTFTGGAPSAGGKNQDVTMALAGMVSKDALTAASLIWDRFEYFEA
ncbi:phage tail tube protein [Mesorhizobium sp. B2-6-1]|uniref:phage tail tube protein n=1 Tax=Mesorhizobium sp. B2-6-1 TaxID=2589916 RepID=UPI00112B83E4|nr:phage tail tube protein [Mesorhizobium sp. B2-6-1]TPJ60823.1 hypothetical protein FJ443_19985 [Mesorhizobium sp. B2-6-1]